MSFAEEWDKEGLFTALSEVYPVSLTTQQVDEIGDSEALQAAFVEDALAAYAAKEEALGESMMRELERVVLLNIIDTRWREHLYEMDYLQEGIYLRSYAQKDPITEYRREAFDMFEELTSTIQTEFVRYIYRVELVNPEQQQRRASGPKVNRVRESHGDEEEAAGVGGRAGIESEPGHQRQGAPERAVPVRQRSEVQEVPRRRGVARGPGLANGEGAGASRRPLSCSFIARPTVHCMQGSPFTMIGRAPASGAAPSCGGLYWRCSASFWPPIESHPVPYVALTECSDGVTWEMPAITGSAAPCSRTAALEFSSTAGSTEEIA